MTLTQLFSLAQSGSYFSRSTNEIWNAINEGSRRAYQAILKENKGFFIVFDISSVTLVANTNEYALPQTCEQILRIREQTTTNPVWRIIRNQALTSYSMNQDAIQAANIDMDGPESQFSFYGPYLKASVAEDSQDDETQSIRIAPMPSDTRTVEICYVAKFLEVGSVSDTYIIPDEARGFVLDFAIAELLALMGDDRSAAFYQKADDKLTYYLTLVRDRQLQDPKTQEPYIDDMD